MNLEKFMRLEPAGLAKEQHEELKKHGVSILEKITILMKNEKYEDIKSLFFHSPAGDGNGMDNDCIDFTWDQKDWPQDIDQLIEKLKYLKSIAESKDNKGEI